MADDKSKSKKKDKEQPEQPPKEQPKEQAEEQSSAKNQVYAPNERVLPINIEEEMKNSYVDYSMSVIVGRALPDARDGLKPVHRRVLYAMQDLGLLHNRPYKKSARVVGECFVKDTMVLTTRGLIPIQDICHGDSVYTQGGIRKVTELYEMPTRPLLKVDLENGISNVVTPSQKFRVLTHDLEFAWKEAKDLSSSDHVVVRSTYPEITSPVKLISELPEFPSELNEDVAYLLGFWLSDGWIEKATGRVGFYSVTRSVIERISKILKEQFSLKRPLEEKPYTLKKNDGSLHERMGYQVRVSRGSFTQYLSENFGILKQDAWTKQIPNAIFRSPKSVVLSFISGLMDGDGSIHVQRNSIHYGSTSEKLISQLAVLFQHMGFFCRRFMQHGNSRSLINGKAVMGRRPFHYLEVRGTSALLLAQSLSLSNPEKKHRANRIGQALFKKTKEDVVPWAGEKIFAELSAKHLGSGWYQGVDGNKFRQGIQHATGAKIRYSVDLQQKPLRTSQILEWGIAEKLEKIGSPLGNVVSQILEGQLHFFRVATVQPVPAQPTFDIEVAEDHQFIANGMVVHNCLGKYHPHGDTAVYDTMVRMVQDFSLRYPLIDGQGNFGSVDGDNAAAMRYTEVRLHDLAEEMLADLDKNTVNFRPNFDESLQEPVVLPAKVPNLLINGSSGIAVGMATNIPPHNLGEVVEGIKLVIDEPEVPMEKLMKAIKAPDFPTGGQICGLAEVTSMYKTGRGLIKVRAKAGVEETKNGKEQIIVTEIPFTVNKSSLIEKIADLINNKVVTGVSDLRDESDKDGMRIVIELKRGEIAKVVLNQLYKHTQMQTTFGAILLALDKGRPKIMNLKQLITCYIDHRKEVVIRRTKFELEKAEARAHILEGYKIALAHIDEVVKIIRTSKDRELAKDKLMSKFKLSEIQANAILDLRLYQLTNLEIEKIEAEYLELIKRIEYLRSVLASEKKVLGIIKEELDDLKKRFGDERRTELVPDEKEIRIEDLVANESCLITISHMGYIKRTSVSLYRQQKRGGKGVGGMDTKEEDYVEHLFTAQTHDYILFFTNKGMLHWQKVYDIPQAGRMSKGKAIVNLLAMPQDQKIAALLCVRDFTGDQRIFMATKLGTVKKTPLGEFSNPRKAGIIAIKIEDGDELIGIKMTTGHDEVVLATKEGQSIRFPEAQVKDQGRATMGVRGIMLDKKDEVVSLDIVEKDATLLVVTERGYGKRTDFDEYRVQNRGGKGIIGVKTTDKNGYVVGVLRVVDKDEIMMISSSGKMVRTAVKEISVIGRNTQGVRLINLGNGDKLEAVTRVISEEDEGAAEEAAKEEVGTTSS